ncbi:hypothetical protein OSB04_011042 [Centaurea solstitialis]|uniref:Ubiquitin-like protease family profile domain-containing protein n=1 Tax=Centaurea solstitialis TaxID=347529 RepID=A0AA38TG90_9ASTR|nr:hypothetical protein OSB04_011042 [Centaurea solstitialis]
MKMKNSCSRFTNTASNPILIASDDDDQFHVSNNQVMEGNKLDNSSHPSGDENETARTHVDEVIPYLRDSLEIHTGVESLLKDLTMEDKQMIRGSRKVLAEIATENINRQSTVAPHAFTASIPMGEFLREPVLLEGSSSRGKATLENLNEELNEQKVVASKTGTTTEWKVDKMAKEENCKKRKLPKEEYADDEKMEVKYNTIRTRTSPRTLYETVIGLNENQKDALYELGLGSIANMTTDGVPDKLAYYVVDVLDPSNMYLKVNTGVILVTIQSIHELLGLPTGGVDLIEATDSPFGLNLVKDWKQQFQKANVRPSDVSRLILKSDSSGFMFKVNFLVLFTSLMMDCYSSGICNFSFLSKIENEQMLSNIDWCEYLYESLRTSKEKWKPNNPECFYSGPLTYLLLLYVNATISKRVFVSSRVSPQSPAITVWNLGLLRKRQTTEIEDGGFGLLPIKESYMQNIQNPKNESIKSPTTPPMEPSKEAKMEAEETLETAVSKYPDDALYDKYKIELDKLFNTKRWFPTTKGVVHAPHCKGKIKLDETVTTTPLSTTCQFDECWNSPGFVAEANEAVDREEERSEKRKSAKKLRMPDFTIDAPSFDLGISPEKKPANLTDWGNEESIIAEPIARGSVAHTKVNRKIKSEAELTPQETSTLRGTRRSIKLGDHLCSPFVNRMANFNPTVKEKRVHEWALASFGLRCDQVFNSSDGVQIIRAGIESLAAHTTCYTSVLDAWESLLNYEERRRNRDSPRRYFFNTAILGNMHMRTRPTNISNMYPLFKKNLSFSAKNNKDVIRLKDIDLAFFPIIKHDHFYVIVFNFKNPAMTIIDSEKNVPGETDAMIRSYGFTPEILHMLLAQHLQNVGHPLAHTLKELEPERLMMDWQIGNVFDESAVFTMRFMETYMGQQRNWKPGFETNATRQVSQISDLRAKYVAKLLYSPCNSKKEYVEKQVERYFTIDQSIRFDMLEQARITRWERLNPYYYPK